MSAMLRVHALAALMLLAGSAGAQQQGDSKPVPDDLRWVMVHAGCVVDYSYRFAATKEPPSDIAVAGLVACKHLLESGLDKTSLTADARHQITADIEERARRLAIRGVLEKRYPASK